MTTTQTNLSAKITGNDYLSAYGSRMKVNPKNGLIHFIRVENEDKQIVFGFTDVPYRWYLQYDIDRKLNQGSGRTLKEQHDYDSPFTAAQIIEAMQPKVNPIVKPLQYLQLFTIS